jgi:hypothetical protein
MTLSNSNQLSIPSDRETVCAADNSLSLSEAKAPSSASRNLWKDLAQRFGVNSALLSGAIGIGALDNLVPPSVARGELITFFGTQEEAKARGAAQTAQFGGNAVYVRANYEFPGFGRIDNYFSGFLVDANTLGSAGHTFDGLAQYNPNYFVGLSADYKSPTIEIPLTSFQYHPSYQGGVGGSGYDLVRGQLAFAAPGVSNIAFWTGPRPAAGTDVLKIGYGVSGNPSGYDFADQGAARGGFSSLSNLAPVLGSADKYMLSITDFNRPDGGRAASKDSGGQSMVWNPSTGRFELALMQIGGSLEADGPVTEHLYIDNEARNFLTTAVPEPSSFLLMAAAGAGLLLRRRWLDRSNQKLKNVGNNDISEI